MSINASLLDTSEVKCEKSGTYINFLLSQIVAVMATITIHPMRMLKTRYFHWLFKSIPHSEEIKTKRFLPAKTMEPISKKKNQKPKTSKKHKKKGKDVSKSLRTTTTIYTLLVTSIFNVKDHIYFPSQVKTG